MVTFLDASYALAVAGAALIWPPASLIVAAVYLLGSAILAERRRPEVGP